MKKEKCLKFNASARGWVRLCVLKDTVSIYYIRRYKRLDDGLHVKLDMEHVTAYYDDAVHKFTEFCQHYL